MNNIYTILSNIVLLNRDSFSNQNRLILIDYLDSNRLDEYLNVFVCPENHDDMRFLIYFLDHYLPKWRDKTFDYDDSDFRNDNEYADMEFIYYAVLGFEIFGSELQNVTLDNERYLKELFSLQDDKTISFLKGFDISKDLPFSPLGGFKRSVSNKDKLINRGTSYSFYFDIINKILFMFKVLNIDYKTYESKNFKKSYDILKQIIGSRFFKSDKSLFGLLSLYGYLKDNNVSVEDILSIYYEVLAIFEHKSDLIIDTNGLSFK